MVAGRCDEADVPVSPARSPSRNTPSAGSNTVRWQVSRLAEQDFSSDPRLPDPVGSVAHGGSLRSRSRGRLLFGPIKVLSHSLFACRRTGTRACRTICPSEGLVKPKEQARWLP